MSACPKWMASEPTSIVGSGQEIVPKFGFPLADVRDRRPSPPMIPLSTTRVEHRLASEVPCFRRLTERLERPSWDRQLLGFFGDDLEHARLRDHLWIGGLDLRGIW